MRRVWLIFCFADWSLTVSVQNSCSRASVLVWNLLAREYTHYNLGHQETRAQTRARYSLAGDRILRGGADLVLLQECDQEFFEAHWNANAATLLNHYHVLACRVASSPGTAILVKRVSNVTVDAPAPTCVGGSGATGGPSKIATVIPVVLGSTRLQVVSVHLAYVSDSESHSIWAQLKFGARKFHLEAIARAVDPARNPVLLGGDLNTELGADLAELTDGTLLGAMRLVQLAGDPRTNFAGTEYERSTLKAIDHVFISDGFEGTGASQYVPAFPYAPNGSVVQASDHAPLSCSINRCL